MIRAIEKIKQGKRIVRVGGKLQFKQADQGRLLTFEWGLKGEGEMNHVDTGLKRGCLWLTCFSHYAHAGSLHLLELCVNTDFIFWIRLKSIEAMPVCPATQSGFLLLCIYNQNKTYMNRTYIHEFFLIATNRGFASKHLVLRPIQITPEWIKLVWVIVSFF